MVKKINYFYTKVFLITGVIALITIVMFGIFAGMNSTNTIKERTLNHNENMLYQINISFVDKINSFKSLLIKVYESNENHKIVSSLTSINEKRHPFYIDPFYKQKLNQDINKIFSLDDLYIIGFINHENKSLLLYNLLLESWEAFDSNTLFYKNISQIINNKQYETLSLERYFTSSINYNVVIVEEKFRPIDSQLDTSIIVGYNSQFINDIINEYEENYNGETLILNDSGNVIFSSNKALGKYVTNNFFNVINTKSKSIVEYNDIKYYLTKNFDKDNNLYFINLYYKSTLQQEYSKSIRFILFAILISLLALSMVYYSANKVYGKRTTKIIKALESVGLNNLDYRIYDENSNDEFSLIADKFNKMCDDLKDNIEKSYIYQLKEKVAELGEMQATINPHFLYNTLECIRECVINDNKENAEDMIILLSNIFRNTVRKKTIITIREELEISRMTLELFSIRFNEIFEYEIDIDDSILNYGIIKNLQQPIIENYFKHGIDYDKDDNYFSLRGYKIDGYIFFEFHDNGVGINESRLSKIKYAIENGALVEDYHYGLGNINERIKIVFGTDCKLTIKSQNNKGTTLIMKIKASSKEDLKKINICS